jgi:hypothetical protein
MGPVVTKQVRDNWGVSRLEGVMGDVRSQNRQGIKSKVCWE